MFHSNEINEIAEALSKAQGEIKNPTKGSNNPFHKSSYADLAEVLEVCRGPLEKNGLSIVQGPSYEGDRLILSTMLLHKSGQWIKSVIPLPIQKPGSQEIGSCITYMRRYTLAALVGVYQEDDDAEASDSAIREDKSPAALSEKQQDLLSSLMDQLADDRYIEGICKKMNIPTIYNFPRAKFSELVEDLKSKIAIKRSRKDTAGAA